LREKILEQFPLIDYLVTGEGEIAMTELADGKDPRTIQGVISAMPRVYNRLDSGLSCVNSMIFPFLHTTSLKGFRNTLSLRFLIIQRPQAPL